ncbi:MAG TPA: DEAD/DEAH box helicase [Verrucomicrobiae bacterium]|nr:DEAD/DEAH box helicase [Verrucomicrobiae bacterium]
MSLTIADFEGFDLDAAQRYLKSFDAHTRKKGERYFEIGAVKALVCNEPGTAYTATVQGSDEYEVSFYFEGGWDSDCSCPVGYECKHTYAALKQLLAAYALAPMNSSSASAGKSFALQKPVVVAGKATAFASLALQKLGRKPAAEETNFLKNISRLFQQARHGGLQFVHELGALGGGRQFASWDRLELYPNVPPTEAEFWNYLALYLTEKLRQPIPEFLKPVTDLTVVRDRMRRMQRGKEIERWKTTLSRLGEPAGARAATSSGSGPAELRMRFLPRSAVLEWRLANGEWTPLKPGKLRDFDVHHASGLSAEAALLWLPYWQRSQVFSSSSLAYTDPWMSEQAGRWFRQPHLRPLLVNADGGPLGFHDAPLRWQVTQPEDADGDYVFSLLQAGGEPLPEIWFTTPTLPVLYLTPLGIFNGPPFEPHLMSLHEPTTIPAKAFESAGGLRLLNHLHVAPPPRLAARVRTIALQPCVRAEVKAPWPGMATEYCYVDLLGASADAKFVEHWTPNGWQVTADSAAKLKPSAVDLLQLDRSALGALTPALEAAGFKWDFHAGRWQLRLTKKFPEIFVPFLKSLPAGTRMELRGELASFQNAEVSGKIRLEASETEMDWFDLRVIVDVNDATLTQEEIKLLLDARGKWVRVGKKGWRKLEFALSAEEDQELARLGLTPHELTSEPQRLHAFQLADKAARKFLPEETCERIERRAMELRARVTPAVPVEIQAEMRPYQRDGFHFLCYLATNHFGGILADDMGLGKTLQTLAWLAWLRNGCGTGVPPVSSSAGQETHGRDARATSSLVVCPKSVADNWHAEALKFFPSLKVRVWSASELKSFAGMLASADLHVLNYSQLRVVGEDLAREKFQAVILDEGQYIKNPSSQTAQIARQLRATHRLVLSGTPIENRLLDLWSLMSFAMPGALGSRAEFGRLFDAKDDPFARQRLSARVRPFLIRRTKAQVARDLPDRMEEDLFCELEGEQKTLYRAELKRAQAMLLGVKTAAALNKERFNFLTSLLRLRQICCHPRLVKPDSKAASAKVEALIETLEPMMEEGEKVLVFSQFVGLLEILRDEIKQRGWRHWYLAGDTENRGELVKDFQAAEGAGVFLISLKAGGFGLNLTASSYVVLFDPWWNPAVENQAIDRTHRIGQARKVIAYRLLIKDSIEEKIRALQKQKHSLANDVLGEEKFSQGLSLDDLRYLLAG